MAQGHWWWHRSRHWCWHRYRHWNVCASSHGDKVGTLTVPTLFKITICVQNKIFGMLSKNCTWSNVRGADKSLAWHTSRRRRAERIVSLERGVCSFARLRVFSCYRGWKEACQTTRAISTTPSHELSSSFLFTARHPRKFTPFWLK